MCRENIVDGAQAGDIDYQASQVPGEMLLAFRYNRHHGRKKDAISINKKNVSLTDSWWLSRKYSPA